MFTPDKGQRGEAAILEAAVILPLVFSVLVNLLGFTLYLCDSAQMKALAEKYAALAEIQAAIQGESSTFLATLVQEQIDAINNATDVTAIVEAKDIALQKLNVALPIYNAGKANAFGEMGEPCEDCPAVEVTGQNNGIIRLYNPKKVEFMKVTE